MPDREDEDFSYEDYYEDDYVDSDFDEIEPDYFNDYDVEDDLIEPDLEKRSDFSILPRDWKQMAMIGAISEEIAEERIRRYHESGSWRELNGSVHKNPHESAEQHFTYDEGQLRKEENNQTAPKKEAPQANLNNSDGPAPISNDVNRNSEPGTNQSLNSDQLLGCAIIVGLALLLGMCVK